MDISLLQDIVVLLGLSVAVVFAFQRLRIPPILGFLLTGIIGGPSGLKLIEASHEVEMLSEIGVILLLFIIGMEFSLKSLAAIKNTVLIGGAIQVGGAILAAWLGAWLLGFSTPQAIFLGFLFSLSSTAIVLKALTERGEVNTPQGKVALAILIFQDIIVVPMMLVSPFLAGKSEGGLLDLLWLFGKAALVVSAVLWGASFLVPRMLYEIAKTRSRELFILFVIVICFAVAWITSSIGLSLALGAFLAGLIISESEYSHQATGVIIPFREIFASIFFVSIGMLADLSFLWQHLTTILGLTAAVIAIKMAVAGLAAYLLGYPIRTVILSGFLLFQVGEFAFILSETGIHLGLISEEIYQYFLAISLLTMAATPFLIGLSHRLTDPLKKLPSLAYSPAKGSEDMVSALKDHLIIIGYGVGGKNVARAAKLAGIPYIILELNAVAVREARAEGEPIYFGDAAIHSVLEHVRVSSARVAVIAISDPKATNSIVLNIRSICHTVHIIARTKYLAEADESLRLGANEVVPEEFESSVEMFTRVLHRYLVPEDEIESYVNDIRSDSYQMLRPSGWKLDHMPLQVSIPQLNVSCVKVQQQKNQVVGKTLQDADIRAQFGVNLLAIQRGEEMITNISPETRILTGDLLFLSGPPESISHFHEKVKI